MYKYIYIYETKIFLKNSPNSKIQIYYFINVFFLIHIHFLNKKGLDI